MTAPTPRSGAALTPIRVLIAEDEAHLGAILEQFMTARGFAVTIVRNGRSALERIRTEPFDVALLDIVMPELDGLEVLRQAREEPLPPEIIMITGNGTVETAVSALKLGAYDVLSKPYRMAHIESLVRRAWEKRMLRRDNVLLQARLRRVTREPRFLTQYAPLLAVLSMVERIAPTPSPVLITGEPGTGKRLLARVIHERAAHGGAPFVELDCAVIDASEAAAELFGVEQPEGVRGSDGRRAGAVELASGGTLLLAHAECLPPDVQEALEQAMTHGTFARVDGSARQRLGARLVATVDGSAAALQPALRHALEAVRIELPPLRDRTVDVSLLAGHFVLRGPTGVSRATRTPRALSPDAVALLERYRWPGNVRELETVLERALLLARGDEVTADMLALRREPDAAASSPGLSEDGALLAHGRDVPGDTLTLAELERRHIHAVLERTAWHQGRAAEALGISPKTLYRKIREFGFRRPPTRLALPASEL